MKRNHMKLANIVAGGRSEIGLVDGARMILLTRALPRLPVSMMEIIAQWESVRPAIKALPLASAPSLPLADVVLRAPIERPGQVMAIGFNYASHLAGGDAKVAAHQHWFSKMVTSVHAPYAPVKLALVSDGVGYDVYVGFIILT